MFDIAGSLMESLRAAGAKLGTDAACAARAQTGGAGAIGDAAMARVAQQAIFTEALLSAVHARLQEVKTASK